MSLILFACGEMRWRRSALGIVPVRTMAERISVAVIETALTRARHRASDIAGADGVGRRGPSGCGRHQCWRPRPGRVGLCRRWCYPEGMSRGWQHAVGIGFILWALEKNPSALDVALDAKPAAVMLSFGDPTPFIGRIRDAGCKVICQVQTLAQAKEAAAAGANVIIAQGRDAGGHSATTRGRWGSCLRWSMPSRQFPSSPPVVLPTVADSPLHLPWAQLAFRWEPASPRRVNPCGIRR